MSEPFRGTINIDIKDSTPDWGPYTQPTAPEGAPNGSIAANPTSSRTT